MPWCDGCEKFYSPNTLRPDGTCPEHHQVGAPQDSPGEAAERPEEPARTRPPWHFWVLLVALVAYLGWRLVQMVGWLVG